VLLASDDMHLPAPTGADMELHDTIAESEQGIVSAPADVASGLDLGAALPHDYVPGAACLSVADLYAEAFGHAVATIL
jgi:hypothetical protein